jgi:hypothetical protein
LTDAMLGADDETDLLSYMGLVKSAVIRSVEELDSAVDIKDTGYFNHSAVPDLVLSWPDHPDRPLYVRRSYAEIAASHDVDRLADADPVLLSVGASLPGDSLWGETTFAAMRDRGRGVLITDAAAMDALSVGGMVAATPISGAVTAAILPSGHGLLDAATAERVTTPSAELVESLEAVLAPEALVSLSRLLDVIAATAGGDLPVDEGEPFLMDEVRELLPWLLGGEVEVSREIWRFIAERITLKHLEALGSDLAGYDLTSLCRFGASRWEAQRASLGLALRDEDGGRANSDGWSVQGKLLTCEIGDRAFRFTTYGQAIKERGTRSSAAWELLRPRVNGATARQVVLRGLARSIRVNAEESPDVQADVESIVSTVRDRYYVDEMTVRYGRSEEARFVRVLLGDAIAFNQGRASVRDLMVALADIAAYRTPVDVSQMTT